MEGQLSPNMGAIWWGTWRTCPPSFSDGEDKISHVPPLFSLRVCIWKGFKTECDVYHVLCEDFFILVGTYSYVDVEREFGVVLLIRIYL